MEQDKTQKFIQVIQQNIPRKRITAFIEQSLELTERKIPLFQKLSPLLNWEAIGVFLTICFALGTWMIIRKNRRKLKDYFDKIDNTYGQFKMKSHRCEAELYRLKDLIEEDLKEGRIEESTFQILSSRVESYLKEVRQQILHEQFGSLPQTLMENLTTMLQNNQVSHEEYTQFMKLLEKTTGVTQLQRDELIQIVAKWKKEDTK